MDVPRGLCNFFLKVTMVIGTSIIFSAKESQANDKID